MPPPRGARRSICLIGLALTACSATRADVPPRAPEPGRPVLRYSIPACPVRYEISTIERMGAERLGAESSGGVDTLAVLDGRPRALGSVQGWELVPTVTSYVRQGKYRPFARPDPGYAPIELVTEGHHWTEREGSAMFYRAAGSQIGMVLLFPELPESSEPGATATWRIELPSTADVVKTEAARGKHEGMKEAASGAESIAAEAPRPIVTTVTLDHWTTVGGAAAAVLTMAGAYDLRHPLPTLSLPGIANFPQVSVTGSSTLKGRYVVLGTGRLLSASIDVTSRTIMKWTDQDKNEQSMNHAGSMRMEARLVSACDGPVEHAGPVALSREDAAIDASGVLAVAIDEDSRERALALLAPELSLAHDADSIWKTLRAYVQTRGARAFVPPVLIDDESVKSAEDVTVVLSGSTQDRTQTNTFTPVEVEVTLHQTPKGWLARRIRARAILNDQELLEVSPERLFVAP
jgi:hypothetical protein